MFDREISLTYTFFTFHTFPDRQETSMLTRRNESNFYHFNTFKKNKKITSYACREKKSRYGWVTKSQFLYSTILSMEQNIMIWYTRISYCIILRCCIILMTLKEMINHSIIQTFFFFTSKSYEEPSFKFSSLGYLN